MRLLSTLVASVVLSNSLFGSVSEDMVANLKDGDIIYQTNSTQELLDAIPTAKTYPMNIDEVSNYKSEPIQEPTYSKIYKLEKKSNVITHKTIYKKINNKIYKKTVSLKDGTVLYDTAENKELLDSIPLATTYPMDADVSSYNKRITQTKYKVSKIEKHTKSNSGKLSGNIKLLHVLDGKDNGYDSNTGSTYYATVKYTTPEVNGISATIGGYVVGDTGLTQTDADASIANGQFMGKKTKDKSTVLDTKADIQEAYIKYKSDNLKAQVGHFRLNTPMTRNTVSTVPNLYEGVVATSNKVLDKTTVIGSHITKMAYGARSISDWGIIGEKTTTAGSIGVYSIDESELAEMSAADEALPKNIRRGKFTNFGKIIGKDDTVGMSIVGAINKSIKNTTLQAWEYFIYDIANVTYMDGMSKFKLKNGVKTMVGAQILHEDLKDSNDAPLLVGAKAAIAYKGAKLVVAVNKSNGDAMLNIWGGDPAYTSTACSKNAYRPDVTAVKIAGKYKIPDFNGKLPKNITLGIAHAEYTQSSLINTQKDASETDISIKYKVSKNLLFKVANVQRTSEFDGYKGQDKTQNMTKFVMVYKF